MTKKMREIVEYAYDQAKKYNNIDMLLKCNIELKSGPLEDETKDDINSYFKIAIKNNLSYSAQILCNYVVKEDVTDFKLLFDIVDKYDRFNLFKDFYKYAKLTNVERVKILTRAVHRNCINAVLLMFKHGIKLEPTNIPVYKPSRSDKMNAILHDQLSMEKGVDMVSLRKEKPKSLYGELTIAKVLDKQIKAGRVNLTLNILDKDRINYAKPDFLFRWAFKNDSLSFFRSIENDPKIEIDSRIKSLLKMAINHSAKDIVKYIKKNYKDFIGVTEREIKQHRDLYAKRRPVKKLTDKKKCIVCDGIFMGDNDNAFNTRCPSCEYLNYRPVKDNVVPNDIGPLITMPDSIRIKLGKIDDLINHYEIDMHLNNRYYTHSDIENFLSIELDEPVSHIKYYLKLTNIISIDEVNKFYSIDGVFDVHNDFSHTRDALYYMLNDELREQVELFLCELNEREKVVIKLRFGLTDDGSDLTLEETANILDVTRERVRMIESSAIKKLKHRKIRRRLENYINMDNVSFVTYHGFKEPITKPVERKPLFNRRTILPTNSSSDDKLVQLQRLAYGVVENKKKFNNKLNITIATKLITIVYDLTEFFGPSFPLPNNMLDVNIINNDENDKNHISPTIDYELFNVGAVVTHISGSTPKDYGNNSIDSIDRLKEYILTVCIDFVHRYNFI